MDEFHCLIYSLQIFTLIFYFTYVKKKLSYTTKDFKAIYYKYLCVSVLKSVCTHRYRETCFVFNSWYLYISQITSFCFIISFILLYRTEWNYCNLFESLMAVAFILFFFKKNKYCFKLNFFPNIYFSLLFQWYYWYSNWL